ncbi:MAG: hypothetical protein JNK07_07285 [Alphaproteobacteria bacterium]|nr:hypothetical protein [Alphaproteobacteria bacterium]
MIATRLRSRNHPRDISFSISLADFLLTSSALSAIFGAQFSYNEKVCPLTLRIGAATHGIYASANTRRSNKAEIGCAASGEQPTRISRSQTNRRGSLDQECSGDILVWH